jgi:hypothetical protein
MALASKDFARYVAHKVAGRLIFGAILALVILPVFVIEGYNANRPIFGISDCEYVVQFDTPCDMMRDPWFWGR